MKTVVPHYYSSFRCIADKCLHSCCKGWEIDIDEQIYNYYLKIPGKFGERLRSSICRDGDTSSFILDRDERCPFLNRQGLCDIYTELGENALCQVCSDHPRFRNFFADRTETGLGICCEAAAELILGQKIKTELTVLFDDGNREKSTEYEQFVFDKRNKAFEIFQDRTFSFEQRLAKAEYTFGVSPEEQSCRQLAEEYGSLERMDSTWNGYLDILYNCSEDINLSRKWDTALEQLAVYFVYRHFASAGADLSIRARTGVIADWLRFIIKLLIAVEKNGKLDFKEFCGAVRLFSSEIEYSAENTEYFWSKYEFN